MDSTKEKALTIFRSGLNCAQAVLAAYSEELKIENSTALAITTGFGGGMGRLQETCGAVTGSFMVFSLYNSGKYSGYNERRDNTYRMVQEFSRKFAGIHGSTNCRVLVNCDLQTTEGQQYMINNNIPEKVCEKCIETSITLVEEFIH